MISILEENNILCQNLMNRINNNLSVLLNMNKIQNDFNKYNNVLKQNNEMIGNKNNTNQYRVEVFECLAIESMSQISY
jgi:hypothetical protein